MTLNDLEWSFCVIICFGLRIGLACSAFRTELFCSLQTYAYTVSGKNSSGTLVTGDISFTRLFTEVPPTSEFSLIIR